jgi:hypothetical protein
VPLVTEDVDPVDAGAAGLVGRSPLVAVFSGWLEFDEGVGVSLDRCLHGSAPCPHSSDGFTHSSFLTRAVLLPR